MLGPLWFAAIGILSVKKEGKKRGKKKSLPPRRGIEPRSPAWQAGILTTILPRTGRVGDRQILVTNTIKLILDNNVPKTKSIWKGNASYNTFSTAEPDSPRLANSFRGHTRVPWSACASWAQRKCLRTNMADKKDITGHERLAKIVDITFRPWKIAPSPGVWIEQLVGLHVTVVFVELAR